MPSQLFQISLNCQDFKLKVELYASKSKYLTCCFDMKKKPTAVYKSDVQEFLLQKLIIITANLRIRDFNSLLDCSLGKTIGLPSITIG